MKIREGLSYDDVLLVPRYSTIKSRFDGEIDLSTEIISGLTLKYPIIAANMDSICGSEMSTAIWRLGGLGIIHRYFTIEDHIKEIDKDQWRKEIVCIGVGQGGRDRLTQIRDTIPRIMGVLIDVAHGDCKAMVEQIKWVRDTYPKLPIIAGNVATAEGAVELFVAGADCVKVGVGPGSLCSTRLQTGNGMPQFTAVSECAKVAEAYKKTIIADGGINYAGDCVKALAAGAHAVMIGRMFAGTTETPGKLFTHIKLNQLGKSYRGMASYEAKKDAKKDTRGIEGTEQFIPWNGDVEKVFQSLVDGILSGMSYQNARTLEELRENAEFIKQTDAGLQESRTRN